MHLMNKKQNTILHSNLISSIQYNCHIQLFYIHGFTIPFHQQSKDKKKLNSHKFTFIEVGAFLNESNAVPTRSVSYSSPYFYVYSGCGSGNRQSIKLIDIRYKEENIRKRGERVNILY